MVDTTTTTWVRVIDHAATSLAFSTGAVVLGFLGTRKFVGHRPLLLHGAIFATFRSIFSVYNMLSAYRSDPNSTLGVVFLTMMSFVALTLAGHFLFSLYDLLKTFTRTEAAEMLRRDKQADAKQEILLYQFMAAENRNESARFLASSAATEVPHG